MESCQSIYNDALKCLRCNDDTSKEPYKSKYAARVLFHELENILTTSLEDKHYSALTQGQLAAVHTHLGTIGVDTEELSTGQEHFEKVIEICDDAVLSHFVIYSAILCRNSLAILWALRDEQEKALSYLEMARNLYSKYKTAEISLPPKTSDELFESVSVGNDVGWDALEKLHTLTLYYLAQIMEKVGRQGEAAELCMSTLQRQLAANDYVPLTWATNAATLAQFYEVKLKFRIARRLLAVSWAMAQSVNQEEACQSSSSQEEYNKSVGIIYKRWGDYCTSLLQESYDCLEESKAETPPDETEVDYLEQLNFSSLNYTAHENVSCTRATNVGEATDIFKVGLRWLNDSLKLFTLTEHASTHTEITQQMSTLYKLLAEFDPAPDRKSKMHKRRVLLLSDVAAELNPQYYLNVCRQLNYEVGEAYSAMVDCKYTIVSNGQPTSEQAEKINNLVTHGLEYFSKVLDSFNSDENGVKILTEGYVRPALVGYFRMARLWSKYVNNNKQNNVNCLRKSVEYYKKVMSYCNTHPDSVKCVEEELKICQEMSELLPLKICRILSS